MPNKLDFRHLVFATLGLCYTWSMRHLVFVSLGLCVTWSLCHLVSASLGLCVTWSLRHLVFADLSLHISCLPIAQSSSWIVLVRICLHVTRFSHPHHDQVRRRSLHLKRKEVINNSTPSTAFAAITQISIEQTSFFWSGDNPIK